MRNRDEKRANLLTVSQFAKLVGATRSQLIYYDRYGYFKPAVLDGKDQQAANRRYKLDQVYAYRMLCFLQQLGCTLEEARDYLNAEGAACSEFLIKRGEKLRTEMSRLQTMQQSVETMLRLETLAKGTRPDAPTFAELTQPYYGLYTAAKEPCLRGTKAFSDLYVEHDEKVRGNVDILPAPVGTTYSVDLSEDGRFPVTGVLSLFRKGMGQDQANYVLPATRYLVMELNGTIGGLGWSLMSNRQYLWDHQLKRTSSVLSWNMGVSHVDSNARYAECVTFPVIDGYTPVGVKPTTEGVD